MTMQPESFWRKPQPILGVLLVTAGWFVSHRVGSDSVFDDCAHRGGGFVVLVSFLGLVVAAAGGVYGYLAGKASVGPGRRFFGVLTGLFAVLVGFAIVLQILAGLILPACAG